MINLKSIKDRNIFLITANFFWVFFGFGAAQQYLVPLLTLQGKQQFSYTILAVLYISFFVFELIGPFIISRLGLKKSLIFGTATYISFIISLLSNHTGIIIFSSFLTGAGAGLYWISSGQLIADNSSPKNLGRNFGLQNFGFLLGNLLGITLGGIVLTILPFQHLYFLFMISAVLGLPCALLIKTDKTTLPTAAFSLSHLTNSKFLFLFPIIFAATYILVQTFTTMNIVVLNLFGLTTVGILATIFRISTTISGFYIGKLSDSFNKVYLLIGIGISGLIGSLLFLFIPFLWALILSMGLLGIFVSSTYPICLSLLKSHVSENEYLTSIGVFHAYNTSPVIVSLFLSSFFSPRASFIPGVLMIIVGLPLLYQFAKKYSLSSSSVAK